MEQRLAQVVARLDALIEAVDRITVAIEMISNPLTARPPDEPPTCAHPDQARIVFSAMGSAVEWECAVSRGGCGYHHGGEAA